MQRFSVNEWLKDKRSTRPLLISQPQELTCWTKTSAEQGSQYLYGDRSGLLPYRPCPLPADLNEGYPETFIRKDESVKAEVTLIVEGANHAGADWSRVDICTFRNNLNKICNTPSNAGDGWQVDACYVGSTLFLDICHEQEGASFPNADLYTYYGYKFESLCTGSQVVDATSEFAIVVSFTLGSHRVLMGAEVDCCRADAGPSSSTDYVELKTAREPTSSHAWATLYQQKFSRFWVQSYLAGVGTVVMGVRDGKGVLRHVDELATHDLPCISHEGGHPWDPAACLSFADDVLHWMQQVAQDHPGEVLRFTYVPSEGGIDWQLSKNGSSLAQSLRMMVMGE